MTADDIITQLTNAASESDAQAIADGIRSRALLEEVADLLFIDAYGHGLPWIRKAIAKEARS
jgi:hypothetical protein